MRKLAFFNQKVNKFRRGFVPVPIILGSAAVVVLVAVLGLAVWRTQNLSNVFQKPKATGNTCADLGNNNMIPQTRWGSNSNWNATQVTYAPGQVTGSCFYGGAALSDAWVTFYKYNDYSKAYGTTAKQGSNSFNFTDIGSYEIGCACFNPTRSATAQFSIQSSAAAPSCNADSVSLDISPNPISPNGSVTFSVSQGDASTFVQNVWSGTTAGGNNHPGVNIDGKCGCDYHGGSSCDSDSTTCTAAWAGSYTWTRYWKHCEGNLQNCSNWCSKSKTFTVSSSASCTAITSSASPSPVAAGGAITFSFTSTTPYANVNINPGAGASCTGQVAVSGSGPYTWTRSCLAGTTAGSYTATFTSDASCQPSATVGYTVSAAATHKACQGNACVSVSGAGADNCPNNCQQSTSVPNCTALTGPAILAVGQAGTFSASYSSTQGNLGGEILAGQNGSVVWTPCNQATSAQRQACTALSGTSGSKTFTWTPTVAGTYDVFCRAWNDGIAECRGNASYVDGVPRYSCLGPNSTMKVTVTGTASTCPAALVCAQNGCVDPAATHLGCQNGVCIRFRGAGNNTDSCTTLGSSCSGTTTEVDSCWGNEGKKLSCMDCNGDGVVNILDFTCFQKRYGEKI